MESFHLQPPLMSSNNNNNYNYNYNGYENLSFGENMVKREKWVKHYSSNHEILLVGEGDFSFSLSLAMAFGSASNILATSLDSHDSLINTYKKAALNLMHLRFLGATVLHEVDARQMKDHPSLSWRKFDCIVYNFPHAGFYGSEDNPDMINMHQGLVYDFFSNARWLLRHNGQIHVTHKIKPPYSFWNIEELAHQNSLHLMESVPFDIKDYPMYENKRGHSSTIDESFDWRDSCTFIFTVAPPSPDIYSYDYSSSHFNLQGYRDAPPRVKFIVKAEVRHFPRAAGYAGVLVDEYNSVRAMFWGPLPYTCVNFAELLAIKCALLMYERSHLCYRNVALDVESNSNVAVSWIRSNFGNTIELSTELLEITMALGRIRNPVEFFCSYGEYGGEHYHLVHRLALTALDTTNICERWIPDNTGN